MAKPVILRFVGDTSQLTSAFATAQRSAASFGGVISSISGGLTSFGAGAVAAGATLQRRLTVPILGAAAGAVTLGVRYEDTMNQIIRLSGESAENVEAWSQQVLDLRGTLPQGPLELAEALYFVTSSGIDASAALDVTVAAARAAAVGLGETSTVADALTSAINAYGLANLSATEATDIMIAGVREGKIEADALAGSLGRVIAPAEHLGISFDQVNAAMAAMSLVGLDAEEAATALRGIMMALMNPTKEQGKALADMGLSLDDVRSVIREKGLLPALQMLRDGAEGNVEALSSILPNVRALNGFFIMTGENADQTAQIFDTLANSAGTTDEAFAEAATTTKFKLNTALGVLQTAGVKLSAILLPIVADLAESFAEWATKVADLDPEIFKIIVAAGGAVAALGPLLKIIGNISKLLGFLLTPAGLVVAILAAIGVGAFVAYQKIEPFREAVDNVVRAVRDFVQGDLVTGVRAFFGAFQDQDVTSDGFVGVMEQLGVTARWLVDTLRTAFENVGKFIVEHRDTWLSIWASIQGVIRQIVPTVQAGFEMVRVIIERVVSIVRQLWARFGDQLVKRIARAVRLILSITRGAFKILQGIFQVITAILTGDWGKLWDGLKNIVTGAWKVITGIVNFAINAIATAIGAAMALISYLWSVAWGKIKSVLGGIWSAITEAVSSGVDGIVNFFENLPNGIIRGIGNLLGLLVQKGKDLIQGLWNGLLALWDGAAGVAQWFADLPGKALAKLGDVTLTLFQKGLDFLGGLLAGLAQKYIEVARWLANLPLAVLGAIGDVARTLFQKGVDFLAGLLAGLWNKVIEILNWFKNLPTAIKNAMGDMINVLFDAGKDLIQGFINGVMSMGGKVINAVDQVLPGHGIPGMGGSDRVREILAGPGAGSGVGGAIGRNARGGLITSPMISWLGEAGPELVVPLTRPQRAQEVLDEAARYLGTPQRSEAPGTTVNITQHITALDPREAARTSMAEWQWAMKTAGV